MGGPKNEAVLPHALNVPVFNKLKGKRVVLASASPRRQEILRTFGLAPEIVPSTFDEKLSHGDFPNGGEYAVATGSAKASLMQLGRPHATRAPLTQPSQRIQAVEVYTKLTEADPDNAPDLVIGADTVVVLPLPSGAILEKPRSKEDQMGMLNDYNGSTVSVVTGVTIVQPQLSNPGYSTKHLMVETKVNFADSPLALLQAYVESGEGLDKAGGFAVQGLGGALIKGIEGDYNNVVGFPAQAFFEWMDQLNEAGELLELE